MAKDPAFLFYPNDWMGGTMILTRHNKGCYIDLLVAQFNSGPLSLETIKTVLGTDQASWTVLSKKFKQDSQGNFFNERLEAEKEKRQKFVLHQRENGLKGGRPKNPKETHGLANHKPKQKPLENENENRDLNVFIEKGVLGEKLLIPEMEKIWLSVNPDYPKDRQKDFAALGDLSRYFSQAIQTPYQPEDNGFLMAICNEWRVLAEFVVSDNFYKSYSLVQISKHFQNIYQSKKNGNSKNDSTNNGKYGNKQTRFGTVSNLK